MALEFPSSELKIANFKHHVVTLVILSLFSASLQLHITEVATILAITWGN